MKIISIDPGKDGGLAALDANGIDLTVFPMPVLAGSKSKKEYNDHAIVSWLAAQKNWGEIVVYCEKLQPMPMKFGGAMANYGRAIWIAFKWACLALNIPFFAVPPKTWQKEFGICGDTKKMAYAVASARWPSVDFRETPRCKKPHDGMVDAVLIAEYGRRKEEGHAGGL